MRRKKNGIAAAMNLASIRARPPIQHDRMRGVTDREFVFRSVIRREGSLYIADIPIRVSKALRIRGRISVVARVKGAAPIRGTLVPRGGGAHKIFLNGEVRREARVGEGDSVTIAVRVDRESREVEPPRDLVVALRDAGVLDAFLRRSPGWRLHVVDWIEEPKSEEARERRVTKVVERTLADHERRMEKEAARGK